MTEIRHNKSHIMFCKTNMTYITRKLFEGGIEWSIFRSMVALDIRMAGRISETKTNNNHS
jgi:hypothetical protein